MPATIFLEPKTLPNDFKSRQQILARYFQRQEIAVQQLDQGWQVQTKWSPNSNYYIDPELDQGLSHWSSPLTTATIPLTVSQDDGFLLALNDCWSLLSWSLQLSEWQQQGKQTHKINLIHLDSHTDMSSPRLGLNKDGSWQDLLTGKLFNVNDPSSVTQAMMSGAIGIGSFISPLLAGNIDIDLYHLSPAQHFRYEPDQYSLTLDFERSDPLFPSAIRSKLVVDHNISNSSYTLTDDLAAICRTIDHRYPVFLHIDLDYFNNRFDGRPDWQGQLSRHDPSIELILAQVDSVFSQLHENNIKLIDICVGVSPGFFPAEYWQTTLKHLRKHIAVYNA